MDIKKRLEEVTQKFEQLKTEREHHLGTAEENLTEMTKLQGEWRLLTDMQDEEKAKKKEKPNA